MISKSKNIILGGDFNVNILNDSNSKCRDFLNNMYSNSFLPLINKPTRISLNQNNNCRSTLIDHIWTNMNEVFISGIIKSNISDHFPNFTSFNFKFEKNKPHYIKFRDFSVSNKDKFIKLVSEYKWDNFIKCEDVNINTNNFVKKLTEFYNISFPLRNKQITEKRIKNGWLTEALLKSIDNSHILYRRYASGSITYNVYSKYKNLLTKCIRSAKTKYFREKFESSIGDMKKTWKTINSLINKTSNYSPESMKLNDKIYCDKKGISNAFASYFSEVSLKVVGDIVPSGKDFKDYLLDPNINSIFLLPTSNYEVNNIINNFKSKNSNISMIPSKILKLITHLISPIIANLFNESITKGVFPDVFKHSYVIPLHKSGEVNNIENYRPISTSSFLAKIFEKLMFKRLSKFLVDNKIISSNQFGFQANKSTEDALLHFMDSIYKSIDNKKIFLSTFLDFKKAFDTVSHKVLLAKLFHYGIRGNSYKWFSSYLCDRTFSVNYKGFHSDCKISNIGIPQGTILGPCLFLIYINDITNVSNILKFILFADDTTVFYSDTNYINLFDVFNNELKFLDLWIRTNLICLNLDKTKFMIISNKKIPPDKCELKINNYIIQQVNNFKFLGVFLDKNVNFREHINILTKKLSRSLGIFKKLNFLPPDILRLLYFSLVHSHISYGILIWGCTYSSILNSLVLTQKKFIRILAGANLFDHTSVLFKNLLILKLQDLYKFNLGIYMFKLLKLGRNPTIMNEINIYNNTVSHTYNFRSSTNFKLPLQRTNIGQRTLFFSGPKLWNYLPDNIKSITNLYLFKKHLKNYFLNVY